MERKKEYYDFFKIEDCFKTWANIPSILIQGEPLDKSELTCDLSITIPTYKRAETLRETLESVFGQEGNYTYQVIVVDNNPERDDETERMIAHYSMRKDLLYYKNTENLGMAGNWNRCIELANTKWAIILHDDDLITTDYIKNIVLCLKDEYDGVFIKMRMFDEGKIIPEIKKTKHLKIKKISILYQYLFPTLGPSGNALKVSKIKELGGFSNEIFAPDVFFSKLAYYGNVFLTDKVLGLYRRGINESFKTEAQDKMCLMNHDFRIQVFEKIGMPKLISNNALLYSDILFERGFQDTWNNHFKYSKMPNYSMFDYWRSKIAYKIMEYLIKIKRKREELIITIC